MIENIGIYLQATWSAIQTFFSCCVFSRLAMYLHVGLLVALTCPSIANAQSEAPIDCPLGSNKPFPDYAKLGDPPNAAFWNKLSVLPDHCFLSLESPAKLTIALAGTFAHAGTVEDIAARLGAISKTIGLPYWSTTDKQWNVLISDAVALNSLNKKDTRPDFTSDEVLSGQALQYAQDDTRTSGLNLYTSKALDSSSEHLVFASRNSSPIKIGPITIFKSEDAQSVLFMNRLNDTTWSAYSLSVIKRSVLPTRKESLINRQIAFYRLLTGQKPDDDEPPFSQ